MAVQKTRRITILEISSSPALLHACAADDFTHQRDRTTHHEASNVT
jgi:hypothetical protein